MSAVLCSFKNQLVGSGVARRQIAYQKWRASRMAPRLLNHLTPFFQKEKTMISWALTFLVIAIIAAILGFSGVAGTAAWAAQVCVVVFLVLFLVSLIAGRRTPVA
jgi:uncharacterized membrane protein YtjA (UPF0391 family)